METLLERLNERAHDPKRATDETQIRAAAPPVTPEQLAEAERHLGLTLPPLLREIYLQVGNGGFGPGYGLFGLPTSQRAPPLPTGLFQICDWGCNIASYVDCTHPDAPVIRLDANMPKADVPMRVPARLQFDRAAQVEVACWVEAPSLAAWLEAWVDGKPLFYAAYGADQDEDDSEDDDEDDEDDEAIQTM